MFRRIDYSKHQVSRIQSHASSASSPLPTHSFSICPLHAPAFFPRLVTPHFSRPLLTQIPAKEASRRIVDDILTTAGLSSHRNPAGEIEITEDDLDFEPGDFAEHGGQQYQYDFDDDDAGEAMAEEDRSPTVVKPAKGLEDETF